ncbi:hypothetical protein Poly41_26440 [Novipirellula artificiosorum]|uniref:Uncharacterized protein n=1 Tax=Novipirellula artificiosorum TaxID=2528016 RepID=A0A5C6DSS3_9BACT|nr:hypothetical protein Poly41_26440 [Novipirellula artificiosorum]
MESNRKKRDPLIPESVSGQWLYGSYHVGMNGIEAVPQEVRVMGSIPPIEGSVPAKYRDGLFEEIVDSSRDRTAGYVGYPDGFAFNKVPMCYSSYSGNGELQWMVHGGLHKGTLSAGTFLEGVPNDGLFLFDTDTMKVIVQPDISHYFEGRDLPPPLGLVELINGRVVGMVSLADTESSKLVDQYLATKPEIRNCLHTENR